LQGDQSFLGERNDAFKKRRDYIVERLNAMDGLSCQMPSGAFYVFVGCHGIIGKKTQQGKTLASDQDVVTYLLEDGGVATVHAAAFGLSPYLRISYATSMENLEKACEKISESLARLS
jgi:aspartate aminotransferase